MTKFVACVFSYGSLREEAVQLANYGRVLRGEPDELVDWVRTQIEVPRWHKAAASGVTHYANVEPVAGSGSRVGGTVFEITEAELALTDRYEREADYLRELTALASGRRAWVYVSAKSTTKGNHMPGTIRLHRVLCAPPARVYKAFLDDDARAKWLPPYGFTGKMHESDARVGGKYRMSFTNFATGNSHSFGGEYLEMRPGEKLRYADRFDDPNLPGTMEVTVTFRKVPVGTELEVVQAGIPDAIPPEACYLGWQESLEQLAKLVNPEIPD